MHITDRIVDINKVCLLLLLSLVFARCSILVHTESRVYSFYEKMDSQIIRLSSLISPTTGNLKIISYYLLFCLRWFKMILIRPYCAVLLIIFLHFEYANVWSYMIFQFLRSGIGFRTMK